MSEREMYAPFASAGSAAVGFAPAPSTNSEQENSTTMLSGVPVAVAAPTGPYAPTGPLAESFDQAVSLGKQGAKHRSRGNSDLFLAEQLPTKKLPTVNLLPPEVREKAKQRRVKTLAAGAVAVVIVLTTALAALAQGGVSAAQARVDEQQSIFMDLQSQQARFAQVPQTRQQLAQAEATLRQAMGQEVLWSTYLSQLGRTVPSGVWLTQMSTTLSADTHSASSGSAQPATAQPATGVGLVEFTGHATSYQALANWIDVLNETKGYSNAFLTGSQYNSQNQVISFTSRVTLTEESQARRF